MSVQICRAGVNRTVAKFCMSLAAWPLAELAHLKFSAGASTAADAGRLCQMFLL